MMFKFSKKAAKVKAIKKFQKTLKKRENKKKMVSMI